MLSSWEPHDELCLVDVVRFGDGGDEFTSEFSLFEALRETIYSEVATLISQNESRPHYLIQMFRELQLLNTDYLRQRFLYSIGELVNKFLTDDADNAHASVAADVARDDDVTQQRRQRSAAVNGQLTGVSSSATAAAAASSPHWSSAAMGRFVTSEMTPSVSLSTFEDDDMKV